MLSARFPRGCVPPLRQPNPLHLWDQLTVVDHSYQTDEAYTYDANGDRRNTGYATTTNNRLLRAGVYTYTYDNEGNRLKRTRSSPSEVTDYTWHYHNLMLWVKTSGHEATKLPNFYGFNSKFRARSCEA